MLLHYWQLAVTNEQFAIGESRHTLNSSEMRWPIYLLQNRKLTVRNSAAVM